MPQRIIISITCCRSVYLWHLIESSAFLVHKIKLGDCNVCAFVCADVNECSEKTKCQCPQCLCKNMWGSYDCTCSSGLLYIHEHDTCISESCAASSSSPLIPASKQPLSSESFILHGDYVLTLLHTWSVLQVRRFHHPNLGGLFHSLF